MRPIRRTTTLAITTALLLAGCASAPEAEPDLPATPPAPTTSQPAASAENLEPLSPTGDVKVIAENLETPWSIAFYGDTPVVSERDTARILELNGKGEARELTTVDEIPPSAEGGLLGVAVRQNYLYAYFTAYADNRIYRYEVAGTPGALALSEPEIFFTNIPAASSHNGGRIAFGPDDMLYITTGDVVSPSTAQDLNSLGGKILRLTPDGDIPDDNPFEGSPVYSYGHRNPQGLAWSQDGTLYASEFGDATWDELNRIVPGGNYGWPEVEGTGGGDEFIDPIMQWPPAEASPSGIAVHHETLYMTALRGRRLWEIPLSDIDAATDHFVEEHGRLRDIVATPDGELWLLTNNTDGRGSPSSSDDRILSIELEQSEETP